MSSQQRMSGRRLFEKRLMENKRDRLMTPMPEKDGRRKSQAKRIRLKIVNEGCPHRRAQHRGLFRCMQVGALRTVDWLALSQTRIADPWIWGS
jgi:hypothetical protein